MDAAKAAIEAALVTALDQQVAEGTGVPAGLTLFPETRAVGDPDYETDPASLVGTEAAQFDVSATAQGSALAVDPSPIAGLAEAQLRTRVTAGWTLAPETITPDIGTPAVVGDAVTYPVTIEGTQVRDVDQAAILASIKGHVLAQARAILEEFGDIEIALWPDWVTPSRSATTGSRSRSATRSLPRHLRRDGSLARTCSAIDLGERRIGLAIAERGGLSARPLATVNRAKSLAPADDARTLARIVAEQGIVELVVGLPLEAGGGGGPDGPGCCHVGEGRCGTARAAGDPARRATLEPPRRISPRSDAPWPLRRPAVANAA